MTNANINILHRIMEARREKHAMAKVKMDKRITIHKICINSNIERTNANGLKYTVGQPSLFVDNPDYDCVIRSDIKELIKMSEECRKLKGTITKIKHITGTIHAKKLAATDNVRDKPRASHRCNTTMERRAACDQALLNYTNNKAVMNAVISKGQIAGRGRPGPYIDPSFEDTYQPTFSGATDYNQLANRLKDMDHLHNLDYVCAKFNSSVKEITQDDNDNSAKMSSSSMREITMDMYRKSTTTIQDTVMKARQATNHATKYLAANNIAIAKNLSLSDENRNALLAHYKNLPPPRISPNDESHNALPAFYGYNS